jgi:hypothetical protein
MDPRTGIAVMEKRNVYCPCWESNPDRPARRYTEGAISEGNEWRNECNSLKEPIFVLSVPLATTAWRILGLGRRKLPPDIEGSFEYVDWGDANYFAYVTQAYGLVGLFDLICLAQDRDRWRTL